MAGSFEDILSQFQTPQAAPAQKPLSPAKLPSPHRVVIPAANRRNFKPGICPRCSQPVAVAQGFLQREEDGWKVYCSLAHARGDEAALPPQEQPRRVLTARGEIYTPFEAHNLDHYRSFPGAKFEYGEHGKCWKISLAREDRPRVLELADMLGLDVAPELRAVGATPNARLADRMGCYPFQVEGVEWLTTQTRNALLGDEMGLGKTPQALFSIHPTDATLVVCPNGVKYNWRDEAKRWRPDLQVRVCQGRHMFSLPLPRELVICNYDILPEWLLPVEEETPGGQKVKYLNLPKDAAERLGGITVIFDEAHTLSNKTARSTKARVMCERVRKRVALTGTPLRNNPSQLLRVLQNLGMLEDTFGTVGQFRAMFNAYRATVRPRGGQGEREVWRYGMPSPEVPLRLRRVMLRRLREDVFEQLPERQYQRMQVDYPPGVGREMDAIWQRYRDEFGEQPDEFPPFEWISRVRAALAESRIGPMLDYVEECEAQDTPLVVACSHRQPIDVLANRPGWVTVTGDMSAAARHQAVTAFQEGRAKGIGLTTGAGATGINLTRAWLMLEVDLDWTPANNHQMEHRIDRIGQRNNRLQYVQMVSNHPLEVHLHNLLIAKQALIEAAIELRTGTPRRMR